MTFERRLKNPSLLIGKNYIDGQWVDPVSGKTFEVHDPATGKLIGTCPESNAQDADTAIKAASVAFASWRSRTGRERARILRRWYDLLLENADDLAVLIGWENGKAQVDAAGEVLFAASFIEWFSEEAGRIHGDVVPHSAPGFRVSVLKEPVGVCGLIAPWNFPAAMVTRKIGPALAAGCTVVIKTAGETPFTANALAALGEKAGVPKGVVNIVCALDNTPEVGLALCQSPIVHKISFTGSTRVGRLLMKQSSDTIKKLSLELGGNAPVLVFNDADLDVAVKGVVASKFKVSGQTCVCANRIFVQSGIYDEFVRRLVQVVQTFKVGNGADPSTTHGPLIHVAAADRVTAVVDDAVSKGAKVAVGGRRRQDLGPGFYEPTVLTDVTGDMRIFKEEIFGPIAPVLRFTNEEEAVDLANSCDVGLASYVYTQDINTAARVTETLQVGMVALNTGVMSDAAAPFGGVKQSGLGREGSKYGIEDYLQLKTVVTGNINVTHRAHI
ncbi:succinate-semialdehyde dehydrogenase [Niveomyces insectorum RCEF 264]|uniref:Succinate-semialdehyde dehydrogenase n=1 Tax=Niveomyces insectorum RCEF 264 TaxID=1081102 RepID=A0A167W940_9HYPO|nr:succinate-semialdehyde dehydrogenase [Niveomyces insectorum RCEF 264]